MITETAKDLLRIRSLILNREYESALIAINSMNTSQLTENEKALLDLAFVNVNLSLGNIQKKTQLEFALSYFEKTNQHDHYAMAKYLCGWMYLEQGELLKAQEYFTESRVYFKRCNLDAEQARVLSRLAYISFKSGNLQTAIQQLTQSRQIYVEINDYKNELSILKNIHTLYYTHGKLKEAECVLKEIVGNDHFDLMPINISFNIALSKAHFGEFATAIIQMKSFKIKKVNDTRQAAIYYEYLGWIHLLAGEYQPALEALQQGLSISLEIAPKSDLVSQIKRRIADVYFGLRQYDKSKQFADEALQVSENLNERVEIAACWRVYGQLDAIAGKEESAREWFTKSIELFSMIESNYDLAVTRHVAATTGLYHNGERRAMLYLAREYFASEDVRHYVKKIDDEFQKSLQDSKPVKPPQNAPVVIAASAEMKKAVELAEIVSQADMTILLTGDTGTGKDLLAQYIHDCSGCKGPFVAVNIAGIPESMIEGELFGHRKGAFTGASHARAGLLEMAHNGTFYLNEVNSTPPAIQAKLLDVLERRKIRRLGENIWRDVSFRLISATNHELEELIRRNEFRADFYHRIKQVEIALPSLLERPDDIPALIRFFLTNTGMECDESQAQAIASRFESHLWSGNVRELKAEIEKLALLSGRNINKLFDSLPTDDEYQKEQLRSLLEKYNWNRSRVAQELGLTEGTIRHRIRKFKLL
ncbi:MAG: sigma 54-interacting transcriptional regulator [Candidatus Zixiibacteriota bacterium]